MPIARSKSITNLDIGIGRIGSDCEMRLHTSRAYERLACIETADRVD